ncbi:MAG: CoA-binding protein [Candidatus Micrarchaeota archaeon]|nr:CoA-binding protein [Candidatus Micrarchaeota archaeon]MDE1859328.1 CoA-binding protein [Candidatus Micrarchaeota archaeon]
MDVFEMLKSYKTVAVVGCSRDESKYSNIVARFLKGAGYRVIPVNPSTDEVIGQKCYKSLLDIPEKIDIVDVFRPSEDTLAIAKQAAQIGAKALWLQEGIINEETRKYAEDKGMAFVQDKCMMKEYMKM